MSIAPPVGAMSAYLARLASGRTYLKLRDVGQAIDPATCPRAGIAPSPAPSSTRAVMSPAARCSRSSASIMSGRSTATISIICSRCCATCATPSSGPFWCTSSRRRAKATRRRKRLPTNITASSNSTVATGAQAKSKGGAPQYTKVSARAWSRGAQGRPHRRQSPRPCRRARGSMPSPRNFPSVSRASASPSSTA